MTNIDELVKALRYCASDDAVCPCKWAEDNPAAVHCEDRLFLQAADAIEALQAELAEYNCDTKIGCPLIEKIKAENISLRAERDALLKAVENPCVQERGD